MVLLILFVIVAASVSAGFSKVLRDGNLGVMGYVFLSGWISPLAWALMAKHSSWPILTTGAVYDIVYGITWLVVVAMVFHTEVTLNQMLGAAVAMLGIFIMNR